MPDRKINYVGLAALITAISTALGSFYHLYNKSNYDDAVQRSIFIIFDYRLRQIEKRNGIDSPPMAMMRGLARPTPETTKMDFNFEAVQKLAKDGDVLRVPAE